MKHAARRLRSWLIFDVGLMKDMKRTLIAGSVSVLLLSGIVLLLAFATWLLLGVQAKRKFDAFRQDHCRSYPVVPMDPVIEELLAEAGEGWARVIDEVNGSVSDTLRLAGFEPSVAGLIAATSYEMPKFNWTSPSQNKKAVEIVMAKGLLPLMSIDEKLYVSRERHIALVRNTEKAIHVFRDNEEGLRVTFLAREKGPNKAPEPTPTAVTPRADVR